MLPETSLRIYMDYKFLLLFTLLLMLLLPLQTAASQSSWDLGIDKVNLVSANVKQGEQLKMAVYVRNNENIPFYGIINVTIRIDESKVPVKMEFICIGDESKCQSPIAPGFGAKDLPARGYSSLVFSVNTSGLEPGAHKLTIEIRPRSFTDPNLADNSYTLSFTVESAVAGYSMLIPLIAALALIVIMVLLLLRRSRR